MATTTCEHVSPGDLITAEFVNCLLGRIAALEERLRKFEDVQKQPEWERQLEERLQPYLTAGDTRLKDILGDYLKSDDTRLKDMLGGYLKSDDPHLGEILKEQFKQQMIPNPRT